MSFDVRSMPGGLVLGERRTFTLRHPYPSLYWRGQEQITFIRTEVRHEHGPAGYVLEYQVCDESARAVAWCSFSTEADHAEWRAWIWLLDTGGPPAPARVELPRRGLLWHVLSSVKTWFHDGF